MLKSACDMRRKKALIEHNGFENVFKHAGCDKCSQNTTRKPMEEIKTKICRKCLKTKPLTDFHKHSGCKYGVDNRCKACKKLMNNQIRKSMETSGISHPEKNIVTGEIVFKETQEKIGYPCALATVERGPKETTGKPNWAVFPFSEAEEVVKVFEYGAIKYGAPFTYRKGIPPAELWSAIMRHLIEIQNGHDIDDESGCLHIAHIAANALMSLSQKTGG